MEEIIKRTFKDNCKLSIIESIIIIIIGFILIIKPTLALKTVINILGVIFLSVGIFKIINYLLTRKKNNFYSYDAIFGIFAFILGIISIVFSSGILYVLKTIIGLWIIYCAVVRMGVSIKLRRLNLAVWTYSLILSVIMLCCGLFVLLNPEVIILTLGIIMIIYSIIDIVEDIILMKNLQDIL